MKQNILQRNNVQISGKGTKPMLFAPGFGCDQNMWRLVAPFFEEHFQVVLFDYVGTGKSDYSAYSAEKYRELNGYASDIIEICHALELKDAVFVGHSVGCTIGMLASLEDPHLFEQLIMIGPSPCYLNDLPEYSGGFEKEDLEGLINMMEMNFIGWANYLAQVVMKNPDRPELSAELEESFCTTDPAVARDFAVATFFSDNRKDVPKVSVPALILQCSDDSIAPAAVGEYMHKMMPASEYRLMNAAGHCPHMSHPEETIELMHSYLTKVYAKNVSYG